MAPYTRVVLRKPWTRIVIRNLHLVHEMYSKGASRSLAQVSEKALPKLDAPFHIASIRGARLGKKTMSEALELLEPAFHLRQVVPAGEEPLYQISKLTPPPVKPKAKLKFKRAGMVKSLYLTTDCGESDLKHKLSKAYEFLCRGCKVELHLRPRKGHDSSLKSVDWALQNCIHLRPEIILASMPKGTSMLVNPVSEGAQMIWVMYLPKERREMKSASDTTSGVPNPLLNDSSKAAEVVTPT